MSVMKCTIPFSFGAAWCCHLSHCTCIKHSAWLPVFQPTHKMSWNSSHRDGLWVLCVLVIICHAPRLVYTIARSLTTGYLSTPAPPHSETGLAPQMGVTRPVPGRLMNPVVHSHKGEMNASLEVTSSGLACDVSTLSQYYVIADCSWWKSWVVHVPVGYD